MCWVGFSAAVSLFPHSLFAVQEEIFDNGVKILPDTVVNVWKGGSGSWNSTMSKATAQGFHTVLSAPFYLNYISYGKRVGIEITPSFYMVLFKNVRRRRLAKLLQN